MLASLPERLHGTFCSPSRTAKALSVWLAPAFGEGALELRPDLDAVEALSTEREALWERVRKSDFLTINEKRAAVGYGEIDGGDVLSGSSL